MRCAKQIEMGTSTKMGQHLELHVKGSPSGESIPRRAGEDSKFLETEPVSQIAGNAHS